MPSASGNAKFVNNYVGFNVLPDGRPLRTEYRRFITDPDFPAFFKSMWGQTEAYGLRFDNLPGEDTLDASNTDFIKVGNHGTTAFDNNITLTLFGDPLGTMNQNDIQLANPTVVQRFPGQTIGAGQQFDIVHYLRSTWSVGDYNDPYTVVLDAPRLVNYPGGGTNGQAPNPMTVRLWLDNQYATIEKDVTLAVVKATLTLPAGLTLAAGQTPVKFLNNVAPNTLDAIDWSIVSDGTTFGDLPISVKIETVPGPTKVLNTIIRVAAAPTMSLVAGPNMVTFPYEFGDNNLDNILNLVSGVDFVAFQWDPELRGYQPVQSVQRGFGYWVVPNSTQSNVALSSANVPADQATGGLLVSLKAGWNLIGNPYNYPVRLSQLVGVAEDNPTDALSWAELVQNEYVTSSLTFFEANPAAPGGGTYKLTTAGDPWVEPHVAYWLFVRTFKELRLVWPPVFFETLPNAGRANVIDKPWAQTDREWKLQLSARSTYGYDANNFVGVISDRQKAKRFSVEKAPQAPGQELSLAIVNETPGQESRMAQAISDRVGRNEWKVQVKADRAGDVTLTWPNLASLPRGIRARITDDVTGEKKDLRTTSGYTFRMAEAGTRSFTLTVEPGGSNRAVIGNVMVQSAGRDANSPVVINYTLSTDALVTVRVLSNTGKEVYTVSRGRSDGAGDNSVTWTLRDNANRAVAPGTYTVEILAETVSGERVRRVVPVNVIR
ncbi:FlgD immunoglobulin-like domain containing protein [Geitlerinema splendidum]|nr:FlgD immunoglobulin-like domain containing protein [Geitlerinema splendidum]